MGGGEGVSREPPLDPPLCCESMLFLMLAQGMEKLWGLYYTKE